MLVDDSFFSGMLLMLQAPSTPDNLAFCHTWNRREGGQAEWNPFNTTWNLPGATEYNAIGVKNYPTQHDGQTATKNTILQRGYYPNILAALRSGKPWGYAAAMRPDFLRWSGGGYSGLAEPGQPIPPVPAPIGDQMTSEQAAALGRIETALLDPKVGALARIAVLQENQTKIMQHLGIA